MSDRPDLKENLLAIKLEALIKWVIANHQKVLTVGGILLAALLIGSVFVLRRKEAHQTFSTRLAMAESLYNQKQFTQAKQILSELRTQVSSPDLLSHILYYSGLVALGEKDWENAVSYFSQVTNLPGSYPIESLAMLNLAHTYQQKKDYSSAAQTYRNFMADYPEHFMAARVQLEMGRVLILSGQTEEGRKALEQLIDLYPTSTWAENARSIMDKFKTR